jgi:homoaconitase/3-isopropylmalate dehydratase large subunit
VCADSHKPSSAAAAAAAAGVMLKDVRLIEPAKRLNQIGFNLVGADGYFVAAIAPFI